MKIQTKEAAMNSSTPKTKPQLSKQLRKVLSGGSHQYQLLALLASLLFVARPDALGQPLTTTLLGSWPGYARGMAVAVAVTNNLAYIASVDGGLMILDVSNAAQPVWVGGCAANTYANGVAVAGQYAYVADYYRGLEIIDVSNPAHPVQIAGTNWSSYTARAVAVDRQFAYVAAGDSGLFIIEVSNPGIPVPVSTNAIPGGAYGVTLVDSYAYVLDGQGGLQILCVSNPTNSCIVGSYTLGVGAFAEDVAVMGTNAYVTAGWSGLYVLNLSNPSNPMPVATYATIGPALGIALTGQYACVAESANGGVEVIDVTDPSHPQHAGWKPAPDFSYQAIDLAIVGSRVYVANNEAGLQILDLSQPHQPVGLGTLDTSGTTFGVALDNNRLYAADGNDGLVILGLNDPSRPARLGNCRLGGREAFAVASRVAMPTRRQATAGCTSWMSPTLPTPSR